MRLKRVTLGVNLLVLIIILFGLVTSVILVKQVQRLISSKASTIPAIYVQIHTWHQTPWGTAGPKDWKYWGHEDPQLLPNQLYSNSSWPHRIISSIIYPTPYPSKNINSSAVNISLENAKDIKLSGSYPLIGLYDTSSSEIVQYQIRSAKNAGIDAFAVSVFDVYIDNRTKTDGSLICPAAGIPFFGGGLDRFMQFLRVAKQENFKVFAEVWIPMYPESNTNKCGAMESWENMVSRVIKTAANDSAYDAYLKIDDKPVVSPHIWFLPNDNSSFQKTLARIEATAGKSIYWMVRGDKDSLLAYTTPDKVPAVIIGSVLQSKKFIKNPNYVDQYNQIKSVKTSRSRDLVGAHIYPGLDDTFRRFIKYYIDSNYLPMGLARTDSNNKNVFQKQLDNARNADADFVFIESWNDYQEQTAIEPARQIAGIERQDPFQDLKTISKYKNIDFSPAPLPSLNMRDPLPYLNFKSGSVSKFYVQPGSTVQTTCDYGVVKDCIIPKTGVGHWQSCSWTGSSGTAMKFTCIAPSSLGNYTHTCQLVSNTSQGCLPQINPSSSYKVSNIILLE